MGTVRSICIVTNVTAGILCRQLEPSFASPDRSRRIAEPDSNRLEWRIYADHAASDERPPPRP